MLCRVEVKQMSLEYAKDDVWFHYPDIDREFVPPLRCRNRWKNEDLVKRWLWFTPWLLSINVTFKLLVGCNVTCWRASQWLWSHCKIVTSYMNGQYSLFGQDPSSNSAFGPHDHTHTHTHTPSIPFRLLWQVVVRQNKHFPVVFSLSWSQDCMFQN